MLNLRKNLLATAAGVVLAAGVSTIASAQAPQFTFNPDLATPSLGAGQFNANFLSLSADDLINFSCATQQCSFTETGIAQGQTFQDASSNTVHGTGLGATYGLDIAFSATGTWTGISGGVNTYNVTLTNWSLYADPGDNSTLTGGNAATSTAPQIQANTDTLFGIATGTLQNGAGSQSSNGFAFNLLSSFNQCAAAGQALDQPLNATNYSGTATSTCSANQQPFFVAPSPFFNVAFDSWAADPGTFALNGGGDLVVAINGQQGVFDFVVPEPATMTLFGSALLGLGAALRRRRGKKV